MNQDAILKTLGSIPLEHIRAAEKRIAGDVLRSPLIRLNVTDAPAEIFLKLENLQPIGSFKLRGTANAILSASDKELERGVWTSSAGNMAQGLAWYARQLWLRCSVVVPENAPDTKLTAIKKLGARITKMPRKDWLKIYDTHVYEGMKGLFIHAFSDPMVMAGNGTIVLEIF